MNTDLSNAALLRSIVNRFIVVIVVVVVVIRPPENAARENSRIARLAGDDTRVLKSDRRWPSSTQIAPSKVIERAINPNARVHARICTRKSLPPSLPPSRCRRTKPFRRAN